MLVATLPAADDFIVGFVSFGPHEWQKPAPERAPIGEIWNNAVHPDFQRRGLGLFMLRELAQHQPAAVAKVKVDNEASLRLFERAGFVLAYYLLERRDD